LSSMKQFAMQSGCHRALRDYQGLASHERLKRDAER
jgi:hypothetical protein